MKLAGLLVSSPKYSGSVSVLKINMIDRWENSEYLVFSSFGDRCTGLGMAIPKFSGLSINKDEK